MSRNGFGRILPLRTTTTLPGCSTTKRSLLSPVGWATNTGWSKLPIFRSFTVPAAPLPTLREAPLVVEVADVEVAAWVERPVDDELDPPFGPPQPVSPAAIAATAAVTWRSRRAGSGPEPPCRTR